MARYRFKLQRVEMREGIMDVEADSFQEAARIAATVGDCAVPRRAVMKQPFVADSKPHIYHEILSGREVR